ncbi:sugar transferase, partial [Enterococcus hirae]
GVTVTGTVDDVRPYLRHAAVAVAPLRIARGIQNKVLEAMAMARPVVASSQAMDGLELPPEARPTVADSAEEWVGAV